MKTKTLKLIAEWAYPEFNITLFKFNGSSDDEVMINYGNYGIALTPELTPKQRLHLQDMYRAWLNNNRCSTEGLQDFYKACESSETLIEAIARDVLKVEQ